MLKDRNTKKSKPGRLISSGLLKTLIGASVFFTCAFLSCKTGNTIKAPEQTIKKPEMSKPSLQKTPSMEQTDPELIQFRAKCLSVNRKPVELCGLLKQQTVEVEVLELLKTGRSLVNIPLLSSKIILELNPKLGIEVEEGQQLTIFAIEKLCRNMSETYYFILKLIPEKR